MGTVKDLLRPKAELVVENAFLRQQLAVMKRKTKRVKTNRWDQWIMVILARLNPAWKDALNLVKPKTLLRWHRQLFKFYWKRKTKKLLLDCCQLAAVRLSV